MWAGTWLGAYLIGFLDPADIHLRVDPWRFGPALLSVALLLFAVSGVTMCFSALGRYRWRVLGRAVILVLVMFLVNVIGQLWQPAETWRPFTLFFYYQPQPIILKADWYAHADVWLRLATLFAIGVIGYLLALWTFCRRDLPAPL
jgi:ABC-2 type transport system permease protein